jgi:hypothetical protein
LTDVEELNVWDTYNYTLFADVTRGFAFSNFSELLYSLASYYDEKRETENVCILIYNSQTQNLDQLYHVINTDIPVEKLIDATNIQFSVDGRQLLDFLYLNIDGI